MNRSPALWPDGWRAEYIDTIRRAIGTDVNAPGYAGCLEVLASGFEPYWQGLKKTEDRPLFEFQLAQIRWYTEHLVTTGLPREAEKQKIRDQYRALWNDAASALTTQFPFLDPNIVHKATDDDLASCYRKIDAPLLPIFLRPLTEAHLERLKHRWEDLRYSRVDLWRQINDRQQAGQQALPLPEHPHYLLTERSLAQLLSQVWTVAASPPEYYRTAVANFNNAEKQRVRAMSLAFSQERRLERERSRQFLQTEEIGFMLTALIETACAPERQLSTPQGKANHAANEATEN